MPIYQYRCDSCQQYSEALRKVSDPPLTECPLCHAQGLRKVIAPVGIIFKGSGFHKNDYSGSSSSKPSSSPAAADKPAETKTETSAPAAAPSGDGGGSSGGGGSDKVA